MSNKPQKQEDQDQDQDQDQEPEPEPDEQDRKELEEARQRDTQSKTTDEKPAEAVESEEVVALRSAFQKFQDKIAWHETQIEEHKEEIKGHEDQIEELRTTLRNKFSGLVGEIGSQPASTPRKNKKQSSPTGQTRTRTSYGDGTSTGDLITSFLKKNKKPINTEELVDFLKGHGNTTNPSVELSRMVGKGLVRRPSRGYYEWVNE